MPTTYVETLDGVVSNLFLPRNNNENINYFKLMRLLSLQINTGITQFLIEGNTEEKKNILDTILELEKQTKRELPNQKIKAIVKINNNTPFQEIHELEEYMGTYRMTVLVSDKIAERIIQKYKEGNIIINYEAGIPDKKLIELAHQNNVVATISYFSETAEKLKKQKRTVLGSNDTFIYKWIRDLDGVISQTANISPKMIQKEFETLRTGKKRNLYDLIYAINNPQVEDGDIIAYLLKSKYKNPTDEEQIKQYETAKKEIDKLLGLSTNPLVKIFKKVYQIITKQRSDLSKTKYQEAQMTALEFRGP